MKEGGPSLRTYLLVIGIIAVVSVLSLWLFGPQNSQILSTVSPPV